MELGEDLGSKYYNSELDRNSSSPILNPKDAAKVFFQYLKAQIDRYIRTNNLPTNMQFAVSIPASFEANQRKELIFALEQNGISINKQSLIDEPNAAFLSYLNESARGGGQLIESLKTASKNILVYDFGAGTCDVSILTIKLLQSNLNSQNKAISRFMALGGDDIDRSIVKKVLFNQITVNEALFNVKSSLFSKKEINEWATRGDTILRNNKPVAVYDHLEYELYNGKENIEISINQFDKTPDNTIPLIRFIHYHHKKSKVEIVVISK
jgi:molecular chaperone DnaK (HSP70)